MPTAIESGQINRGAIDFAMIQLSAHEVELPGVKEIVFERDVITASGVEYPYKIRIYSSIDKRTGELRKSGSDAVRIQLVDKPSNVVLNYSKRVNRVGDPKDFMNRIVERARDMFRAIFKNEVPGLPVKRCTCGAPKVLRKVKKEGENKNRPFLTCAARHCTARSFEWADVPPAEEANYVPADVDLPDPYTLPIDNEEQWRADLASDDHEIAQHAIGQTLVKIFEYQTYDEQTTESTHHHNNVGFNGPDGNIGASMAKYYNRNNRLSVKQVAYWQKVCRKNSTTSRIQKYVNQLIKNERNEHEESNS